MRGIKAMTKAGLGAVVAAAALAVLTVGAGTGAAATSVSVSLTPLITEVSGSGHAAYHVDVANDGPSTITQVTLILATTVVNASSPETASYLASSPTNGAVCAAKTGDATQMVCTSPQLSAGAGFSVNVTFSAPAYSRPVDPLQPVSVQATASATVAANTVGNAGNQGTSTWFANGGNPVSTSLVPPSTTSLKAYLRAGESLTPFGLLLKTALGLPGTLLNGNYGVVTSTNEFDGTPACDKCPARNVDLSMPSSLTPTTPFSATNPFTFEFRLDPAAQPKGYKPTGLLHRGVEVQLCSALPAAGPWPTGMCLDKPVYRDKATGQVVGVGKGYENGFVGFD